MCTYAKDALANAHGCTRPHNCSHMKTYGHSHHREGKGQKSCWLCLHGTSVRSCVYVCAQCGVSEIIFPYSPHGGHFSFTLQWTCNCKPDRETKGRGNCIPAERAKCKENKAKRNGIFELMAEEQGGGGETQVLCYTQQKDRGNIWVYECIKVQV